MSYSSVLREGLFAGKNIIVTGGGSGIGRCISHELSSLGANVIIIGRTLEKLKKVAAEIIEDGGSVDCFSCDIRDEVKVTETIKQIVEKHKQINGLVNNAGGQFPALLAMTSQKGWETVLRTNLTGGFLMTREVLNQSMSQQGGAVVNILADMWGGMPGMGHSGAARAGMDNFTKTAAIEWASSGVRVNAVAPGWILSSGMDTYPPELLPLIKSLKDSVPQKRLGREAEISSAICFLLSDGAAFINGATLRIDGAASLGSPIFPIPEHKNSKPFGGFHRETLPEIAKKLEEE